MNLRFAFAVDNYGYFRKIHFGEADKYIIYEHDSRKLIFTDEIINPNKDIDDGPIHGSKRKGSAVIKFLKKLNVKIVVSMQFGKNIKMVNQYFVPIIVENDNIDSVIKTIEYDINWIKEEAEKNTDNYMLFRVNNGIFKQQFKEYKKQI